MFSRRSVVYCFSILSFQMSKRYYVNNNCLQETIKFIMRRKKKKKSCKGKKTLLVAQQRIACANVVGNPFCINKIAVISDLIDLCLIFTSIKIKMQESETEKNNT